VFSVDRTNPDIQIGDGDLAIAQALVHLFSAARFLWQGRLVRTNRLWNYSRPIHVAISFEFDLISPTTSKCVERPATGGRAHPPTIEGATVAAGLSWPGQRARWTTLEWSEAPVEARRRCSIRVRSRNRVRRVALDGDRCERSATGGPEAIAGRGVAGRQALEAARNEYAVFETSSERFNQWIRRSPRTSACSSRRPVREYPYAGALVQTPFGRDGSSRALQTL
jgi:hypothetical protein